MLAYAAAFVSAGALAFLFAPAARRLAFQWGAVDIPNDRKLHRAPVARLGGAAVLAAVALTVAGAFVFNPGLRPAVTSSLGPLRWSVLAAASLFIVLIGAVDDIRSLTPRFKFLVELAAATAVVWVAGAPRAIDLSPLAGALDFGILGPVLGVLWIVTVTNAVNLMDGVDGVAASLTAVAAAAFALLSPALGNPIAATVLIALSGAMLGFLPNNVISQKLFLGDSGALGAGFVLGSASLVGLNEGGTWHAVPAVLIAAVLLTECAVTVLRRSLRSAALSRNGLPSDRFVLQLDRAGLFTPDRGHIPHRLLDLGLRPHGVAASLAGVAAACALAGVASLRWPWLGVVAAITATAGIVYFAPRWMYHELMVLDRGTLLPLLDNRFIRSGPMKAAFDTGAVAVTFLVVESLIHGPVLGSGILTAGTRTAAVALSAFLGFSLAGLYRASFRHAGLSEALRAIRSVAFGVLLACGISVVVLRHPFEPSGWLLVYFLATTLVLTARFTPRILEHINELAQNGGQRVLVFGAGRRGTRAVDELLANRSRRCVPVGFVDDDPTLWGREVHGFTVHGWTDVRRLLRELQVDDLLLSTGTLSRERLVALRRDCRDYGVRLLSFAVEFNPLDPAEANEIAVADERVAASAGAPDTVGGTGKSWILVDTPASYAPDELADPGSTSTGA